MPSLSNSLLKPHSRHYSTPVHQGSFDSFTGHPPLSSIPCRHQPPPHARFITISSRSFNQSYRSYQVLSPTHSTLFHFPTKKRPSSQCLTIILYHRLPSNSRGLCSSDSARSPPSVSIPIRAVAVDPSTTSPKRTRRRNRDGFNPRPIRRWQSQRQSLVGHLSPRAQNSALMQLETDYFFTAAVAREGSSLAPIRAIQHRDSLGNPIGSFFRSTRFNLHSTNTFLHTADPDRSNPTRSRWERPLDTIRSFEAAIDGNYSRKSYIRTGENSPAPMPSTNRQMIKLLTCILIAESADSVSNSNRRSSYFGGMLQLSVFPNISQRLILLPISGMSRSEVRSRF